MSDYFFKFQDRREQKLYEELLIITGSLSKLFSESNNPFLYYRAAENIFCKAFNAENLSRSDVSADATKNKLGIGLKTFLHNNGATFQKVAEFNRESYEFRELNGIKLILKVAEMRNERINLTKRAFDLNDMVYHLVTRSKHQMQLFEEYMHEIDLDSIKIDRSSSTSNTIRFFDKYNEYTFSLSKNTLLKRFVTPDDKALSQFIVNIHEDPFDFLLNSKKDLVKKEMLPTSEELDFIILPLYSPSSGNVELKSGLNAWNAAPRTKDGPPRDPNEVYIVVPTWIHDKKPGFFNYIKGMSLRDIPHFEVKLPNGKKITMKLVQQDGKAISSNPLTELGKWILRDVLNLAPRQLVTRGLLNTIGIDSVKLSKVSNEEFLLDFKETGSYEEFEKLYLQPDEFYADDTII